MATYYEVSPSSPRNNTLTHYILAIVVAASIGYALLMFSAGRRWTLHIGSTQYTLRIGRPVAPDPLEMAEAPIHDSEVTPQNDTETLVLAAADEFGVTHSLALALMEQESGGDPNSVSWAGARGLLQVMPGTAEEIGQELGIAEYNLDDPTTNARFGMYYLSGKLSRYGHDWGLAAYNMGPGGVDLFLERHSEAAQMTWSDIVARWGNEIPGETQHYVTNITAIEQRFR